MKLKQLIIIILILISPLIYSDDNSNESTAFMLFMTIQEGNLDSVKNILNNDYDINYQSIDYNHSSALHIAVEYNRIDIVDYLLEHCANPISINTSYLRPFDIAISEKFFPIADLMIDKYKYDVNTKDEYNRTALLAATFRNSDEGVEYFLKKGADPNLNVGGQWSYLHEYLGYTNRQKIQMNYSIIKKYFTYGFDPNALDSEGYNFAHSIAFYGDSKLCNYLFLDDLNWEQKDYLGEITPLMIASAVGNIDVLKFILQKNLDIDTKDKTGRTALFYSMRNERTFVDVYNLLVEYGANSELFDSTNKKVTDYIPDNIREEIIPKLKTKGSTTNK